METKALPKLHLEVFGEFLLAFVNLIITFYRITKSFDTPSLIHHFHNYVFLFSLQVTITLCDNVFNK